MQSVRLRNSTALNRIPERNIWDIFQVGFFRKIRLDL
jgi:hypothetical protein